MMIHIARSLTIKQLGLCFCFSVCGVPCHKTKRDAQRTQLATTTLALVSRTYIYALHMEKRMESLFLELGRLRGSTEGSRNSTAPDVEDYRRNQYLRWPTDRSYFSIGLTEKLCQLADESQGFYRSVSFKQWLRTTIFSKDDQEINGLAIHSNVVPRQAYLDATASCLDSHHCRLGFFPASELSDGEGVSRPGRSCKSCALAQHIRDETDHMDVDGSHTTLLQIDEVGDLQDLAQGLVRKILWRSGTFVRKRFTLRGIFERELAVVTAVSHPNIVHCFGCYLSPESDDSEDDESSGSSDLFMEYLDIDLHRFLNEEGESLRSGSPFSFRESLDVLRQIAEAVKHLHEKNFLHGDLKPQNVFMSRFELAHSGVQYYLVKVSNFGCAQRVDSSGRATVEPFCAAIGTTHYTAPEVFRCQPRYGSAAPPAHPLKIDVYSFGVVAFQVLTGVANLYAGIASVPQEVINGLRPHFGSEGALDGDRSSLLAYVKRCWAEDPGERPSFAQICDELHRRSNEHGLLENIAKHKHCDIIGEGANPVKLMKPTLAGSCEQALSRQHAMALGY